MDLILSFGLNVGTQEPPDQFSRTMLEALRLAGRIKLSVCAWKLFDSMYEGVPERAIHVRLRGDISDVADAILELSEIAEELQQECIAFATARHFGALPCSDKWELAYSDGRIEDGCSMHDFPVRI